MAMATTAPGRTPSMTKLTTRMITTACQRLSVKSPMARSTTTGWFEIRTGSIPMGRLAVACAITALTSFAQFQNIAAFDHRDGQRDGRFAVHPQHRLRRVHQRAANGGDIAQPDRAPVRHQRHLEHVGLGREGARDAKRQILGTRVDHAGRAHRVLRGDGVEDLAVVEAHGRNAVGLEFDQDLFVLNADPFDPADQWEPAATGPTARHRPGRATRGQ